MRERTCSRVFRKFPPYHEPLLLITQSITHSRNLTDSYVGKIKFLRNWNIKFNVILKSINSTTGAKQNIATLTGSTGISQTSWGLSLCRFLLSLFASIQKQTCFLDNLLTFGGDNLLLSSRNSSKVTISLPGEADRCLRDCGWVWMLFWSMSYEEKPFLVREALSLVLEPTTAEEVGENRPSLEEPGVSLISTMSSLLKLSDLPRIWSKGPVSEDSERAVLFSFTFTLWRQAPLKCSHRGRKAHTFRRQFYTNWTLYNREKKLKRALPAELWFSLAEF